MGDQAAWRKSTYSTQDTACVEVAPLRGRIGARDSKVRFGAELRFTGAAWGSFVQAAATAVR